MTRFNVYDCAPTNRWVVAAMLVCACIANQAEARSLTEIKKTKELRVCIGSVNPATASVEPADCRNNCKFSGPVYEESLAFAQSLGKNIKLKALRVNFDEQFFDSTGKTVREESYTPSLLASGTCDIYPGHLTKNEWRMKKLDFVTLFPSRMTVIAHKSKKGKLKNHADLAGLSAVVGKDTTYHTWLQSENQTKYAANPIKIELMYAQDAMAAVDAGTHDFTMQDSDKAVWYVRNQLKNAYVAFAVGAKDELGWAFRKEDKDLQTAVQKFFDEQRRNPDSELNEIWKRHFGRSLIEFITLMAEVE